MTLAIQSPFPDEQDPKPGATSPRNDRMHGPGQLMRDRGSSSNLDACPGKRILDGNEFFSHLCEFVVKVFFGIAPEPDNLFFRLSRDLEGLVLLVQHLVLFV
ncbi:hypothetical protein DSECCO2_581940 [anaerobic digester metagenome]